MIQRTGNGLVADCGPHRLAPDRPPKTHVPHQPGDCAACGREAFASQLTPDLAYAVDAEVLFEHTPDHDPQISVAADSVWQPSGIDASGDMSVIS
jgi:hypothetical protein